MLTIAAFAFCLVYFACVLIGVPLVGPRMAPWFLSLLSAAFVCSYLVLARGRTAIALAVVIVVTIVFPLGALIAIGWPVYRTWEALLASFWAAFIERGPLGGVEFLAPTIAAMLCAGIVGRLRSNIVADAPSARRLP
jgi:hypothetical protein